MSILFCRPLQLRGCWGPVAEMFWCVARQFNVVNIVHKDEFWLMRASFYLTHHIDSGERVPPGSLLFRFPVQHIITRLFPASAGCGVAGNQSTPFRVFYPGIFSTRFHHMMWCAIVGLGSTQRV
jgi:hypothetical protein